MILVQVTNDEGEFVTAWEDNESEYCSPYTSDFNGYCGGCPRCMEMQAYHAGFTIVRFEVQNDEMVMI